MYCDELVRMLRLHPQAWQTEDVDYAIRYGTEQRKECEKMNSIVKDTAARAKSIMTDIKNRSLSSTLTEHGNRTVSKRLWEILNTCPYISVPPPLGERMRPGVRYYTARR